MRGRPRLPRTHPHHKLCHRCATIRLAGEFNRASGSPDGLAGWCRMCAAEYGRAWRRDSHDDLCARPNGSAGLSMGISANPATGDT